MIPCFTFLLQYGYVPLPPIVMLLNRFKISILLKVIQLFRGGVKFSLIFQFQLIFFNSQGSLFSYTELKLLIVNFVFYNNTVSDFLTVNTITCCSCILFGKVNIYLIQAQKSSGHPQLLHGWRCIWGLCKFESLIFRVRSQSLSYRKNIPLFYLWTPETC